MMRFLLPLGHFCTLVGFLLVGLNLNPRQVPSPLIGKPAPDFQLEQLHEAEKTLTSKDNLGKVWLLNVWASWCVSCREEHPLLVELANPASFPSMASTIRIERDMALQMAKTVRRSLHCQHRDPEGRTGIDYGVYGVPETYVIDKNGVIRYKQIGPVTVEALKQKFCRWLRNWNYRDESDAFISITRSLTATHKRDSMHERRSSALKKFAFLLALILR